MEESRYKSTKLAGILGMLGNIFLLIIKATIGFLTNSQAMIADSFNSAGDIFASLMTFIGNKIASEPQDDTHNFGHGKAEYIFSLFISLSMIFVAMKLLYDSTLSLILGSEVTFSWFLILVCIVTIIVKLCLFIYTHKLSKKYNAILLEANSKDHRNDCFVTSFTLLSVILSCFKIYWFDGLVGIGISLWIAYTGFKILVESYDILMDKSMDENTKNKIIEIIHKHPEIQKINHLTSSPVGYRYLISVTIFVNGNMSTFESHQIADILEKELNQLEKVYLSIIHVNPI
ncbi:MAG: cation diffusion facilitator family transporter [Clostridia bacterium]